MTTVVFPAIVELRQTAYSLRRCATEAYAEHDRLTDIFIDTEGRTVTIHQVNAARDYALACERAARAAEAELRDNEWRRIPTDEDIEMLREESAAWDETVNDLRRF